MWTCFAADAGLQSSDFTNFNEKQWDEASASLKRKYGGIEPHAALVAKEVRKRPRVSALVGNRPTSH
jgi:hypothetical protein